MQQAIEKGGWPQPGDFRTFYFAQDGIGARLKAELDRLHRSATEGQFLLRRPVNDTKGLLGPYGGQGHCLDPLLTDGCEMYFDPTMTAVDGDIVLTEWCDRERESLQAEYRRVERALAKYRDMPEVDCSGLREWMDQYRGCDLSRATKWYREIDGRKLLLANNTAWDLDDARIVGVLRYVRINGCGAYGSGMSDAAIAEHVTSLVSMDRRPKITSLDGVPIFEGPVPPSSPKTGWLWRDANVNVMFRWNGSAWVDYSTLTRLSGGSLDNAGVEKGNLDGWSPIGGTWTVDTTAPRFGTYHLRAELTGSPRIVNTSRLQVSEGDRVAAMGFARMSAAGDGDAQLMIRFRDASDALVHSAFSNVVSDNTSYQLLRAVGTAQATVVTAEFEYFVLSADFPDWFFDGAWMGVITQNAVGTGQIEPGSATGVFGADEDGPDSLDLNALGTVNYLVITPAQIDADTVPSVTVTFDVEATTGVSTFAIFSAIASWSGGSEESQQLTINGGDPKQSYAIQYQFTTIPVATSFTVFFRLVGDAEIDIERSRMQVEAIKR